MLTSVGNYRDSTFKADSGNIPSPNTFFSLHILGLSSIDHCTAMVSGTYRGGGRGCSGLQSALIDTASYTLSNFMCMCPKESLDYRTLVPTIRESRHKVSAKPRPATQKTGQELYNHNIRNICSAENSAFLLGVIGNPVPWKSGCCGCEDSGMETLWRLGCDLALSWQPTLGEGRMQWPRRAPWKSFTCAL